jgi:hypothetical protein
VVKVGGFSMEKKFGKEKCIDGFVGDSFVRWLFFFSLMFFHFD